MNLVGRRWPQVDTLVILMGLGHLATIAQRLIGAGRAPETPAMAIHAGTLPEQTVVIAPLATLAQAVAVAKLKTPATIVVGEVVNLATATASATIQEYAHHAWDGLNFCAFPPAAR